MITKEKISAGLKERLVTLEVDPNMGSGTVCRIGDWWFYFGGETAEEMNPDEFLRCHSNLSERIQRIRGVINGALNENRNQVDGGCPTADHWLL